MNKRARGTEYEEIASGFLSERNVGIIDRNFRSAKGEIDIIGIDTDGTLVFFEVKYRAGARYGSAAEAVDLKKQRVISEVSDYYRISHKEYQSRQIRFDVIAITGENISWIKNAFYYAGNGF